MIVSGEKLEEYREIKDHWIQRVALCSGNTPVPFGYFCQKADCHSCITRGEGFKPKHFDAVEFTNGYGNHRPRITVECKGINIGIGNQHWGAPKETVFIISLGKIIS